MFCQKLQNLCSVAANRDQMDKNGCDLWTQRPPKPPNQLQTSSQQKSCIPVILRSVMFLKKKNITNLSTIVPTGMDKTT